MWEDRAAVVTNVAGKNNWRTTVPTLRKTFATAAVAQAASGIAFPSDLQATWRSQGQVSLRGTLSRMLIDPKIGSWRVSSEHRLNNRDWTQHCQGVACDGSSWYVSHDDRPRQRGVYKFSIHDRNFDTPVAKWLPDSSFGNHLGAISTGIYRGQPCVFVAYEETPTGTGRIVVLDTHLHVVDAPYLQAAAGGDPPTGGKAPWCAYNPGNGLLYVSRDVEVTQLEAFDPTNEFRHVESDSIRLDRSLGHDGNYVQGAAFNSSGHVFVSVGKEPHVFAFSAFTGALVGTIPFQMETHMGEQAQGLCWAPIGLNGVTCGLHLVLWDWDMSVDGGRNDDIFLKHVATGTVA